MASGCDKISSDEHFTSDDSNSPESKKEINNILACQRALLNSEKFSDVQIVVNERIIYAHKTFLWVHSPVFRMLIESDCAESKNNRIPINDSEYSVVMAMLRYIYTGKVSEKSMTVELLKLADHFQIDGLKNKCERHLMLKLDVENAADMLIWSTNINANTLKAATMAFIHEYKSEVLKSDGWKRLKVGPNNACAELYETAEDPSPSKRPKI